NCWSSVSEHVQGSAGVANINDGGIKYGKRDGRDVKDLWRFKDKSPNPYQVEHDDLFASIRSGNPINEGHAGAISSMTAILGRLCTYSGKKIEWEDAIASNISLQPKEYNFKAEAPVHPNEDGSYPIAVPGLTKV